MFPEIRSLCGINTKQPVDKAAVIEFAHDGAVDDFFQFGVTDALVAARHQALNVAQSFQGEISGGARGHHRNLAGSGSAEAIVKEI